MCNTYPHTKCGDSIGKGKAIPVTGHGGPLGCEISRLPHFLDNWLADGSKALPSNHKLHIDFIQVLYCSLFSNNILNKTACFSNIIYRNKFQEHTLSGSSAIHTTEFALPSC
jgi:hypothetical protein